jgi:tRNA wybutosine-synthesizing protein 3
LVSAERLLKLGVASGFRESGISLGKKRVLVAIRTGANSLETPLLLQGRDVMTDFGLEALVELANRKFGLNAERTQRFTETLAAAFADEDKGELQQQGLTTTTTTSSSSSIQEAKIALADERKKLRNGVKKVKKDKKEWRWVEPDISSNSPAAAAAAAAVVTQEQQQQQLLRRWGHSISEVEAGVYWMFGGWCEKPAGRQNDLVEIKLKVEAPSLSLSLQVLTPSSLPSSDEDAVIVNVDAPEAREKHAAVAFSSSHPSHCRSTLLVFGGRASPHRAFGDLWTYKRGEGWRELTPSGTAPSPRWSHSMTLLRHRNAIVVYGGRDGRTVLGGTLHVLSPLKDGTWTWSEMALSMPAYMVDLPPIFAHTATAMGGKGEGEEGRLFVWGGLGDLSGGRFNHDGFLVDLVGQTCTSITYPQGGGGDGGEGGRYGHAATMVGEMLVITGGVTADGDDNEGKGEEKKSQAQTQTQASVLLLDMAAAARGEPGQTRIAGPLPSGKLAQPLIHHAAVVFCQAEGQAAAGGGGGAAAAAAVVVIGGGVQSFAFSPVLASPLVLLPPSWPAFKSAKVEKKVAAPASKPTIAATAPTTLKRVALPPPPPCPCLLADAAYTKLLKTALERGGLFDRQRRIAPSTSLPGCMAIPLLLLDDEKSTKTNQPLLAELQAWCTSTSTTAPAPLPHSHAMRLFMDTLKGQPPSELIKGWSEESVPYGAATLNNQVLRLQAAVQNALEQASLPPSLLTPQVLSTLHVERLGDILLLEGDHPFRDSQVWDKAYPFLWPALLTVFPGATRVARMAPIQGGTKRRSQVQLLYPPPPSPAEPAEAAAAPAPGCPGWVTVRENGLSYSFDMTKSMFSSGNVSEKARIARMDCRGEMVVDLYAGIGYYTLPLAVHGRAERVVACEWNTDAIAALRVNLMANGVEGVVEVLEGDNRVTSLGLPDMCAHRVHLGLIPSSEEGWPIAARLLREEGGMMHVHGNMLEEAVQAWVGRIEREVAGMGEGLRRAWAGKVKCVHLERVKSYAPSVWHFVADIRCGRGGVGVSEREGEN